MTDVQYFAAPVQVTAADLENFMFARSKATIWKECVSSIHGHAEAEAGSARQAGGKAGAFRAAKWRRWAHLWSMQYRNLTVRRKRMKVSDFKQLHGDFGWRTRSFHKIECSDHTVGWTELARPSLIGNQVAGR